MCLSIGLLYFNFYESYEHFQILFILHTHNSLKNKNIVKTDRQITDNVLT